MDPTEEPSLVSTVTIRLRTVKKLVITDPTQLEFNAQDVLTLSG
jgi:hypothetical protein